VMMMSCVCGDNYLYIHVDNVASQGFILVLPQKPLIIAGICPSILPFNLNPVVDT
jgi:hypothetical protein